MKAKSYLAACIGIVMLGVLTVGCGNSIETEEEIITLKEDGGSGEGENLAGMGEGQDPASAAGELGEIAQQVQAPERYMADFSAGNITVKANAPVLVPRGEGFKTYRVKGRPFEQEDYDVVAHALLKDAGLWAREEYAKEDDSEEPETVEVPSVITVDSGDDQNQDMEAGWLSGFATVDGADYWVAVDNRFREEWRWSVFRIIKKDEDDYFQAYYSFAGLSDRQKESVAFSADEIRTEAVEAVAAIGLEDFVPSGEEYYVMYRDVKKNNSGQEAGQKLGYGLHFTRSLEGIPVTYTDNTGTTLEDENSMVWPYENLTLVYDEGGLVNFVWENPYEVEKVSDEYLFLLPFAEIQNIFEEMIIKKYQDWIEDGDDIKMEFQIGEVRLGYMRVRDKENAQEAAMVPVWDFMGTQKIIYDSGEYFYDENSVFSSPITINALDGTIVDRNLGY